jgi:zinc protease
VPSLARAAVKAFHARYYVARNAVIALVGALDRKQAEALAERIAAPLAPGARAPDLPPVAGARGREHHVTFPSVQSHVRIGLPGISRKDPDYFALVVGNHALGGNSMASILFDEVRNKRGLSYSVSSYFVPMARQGPFIAALQTSGERQDEALRVLRETLLEFVSAGPPPAAIARAKQNLIDGFPLRVASNAQLVEYIAMIGFYDLPRDYLTTFPERVAAITPQAVKDAFTRRVVLDRLTTIVVGRAPPRQP